MRTENPPQTSEEFYRYHTAITNLATYCDNAGTMEKCPRCDIDTNSKAKDCRNYAKRGSLK